MTKVTSVKDIAPSYGIPGESVDGQDVLAVSKVAGDAVARARSGGGPTLVECVTYRFHGHSLGDLQEYRDKKEVEHWVNERDPIQLLRTYLMERQQLSQDEDTVIQSEATAEIQSAVAFAEASAFPPETDITTDVFVGSEGLQP
jgi:pyruvate dehydrogenase E1 component alpha subunit